MVITLKQLSYFHTLAAIGNFGRAAETVHISQPAMSLQIKALEEEFGARLLERNKAGIELTDLGRRVNARADDILRRVDDLATLAVKSNDRPVGPVRLGLIPTIAPYLLPSCFPALRREFADIDFVIREGKTETLLQELRRNRLDLAVLALPIDTEGLYIKALFDEPFYVATGPGFDNAGRSTIPAGEITRNPLLLLEEGHCLRDQTLEVCGGGDTIADNSFAATSLSTIVEMVANDYGVTLLPEMSLAREASDPRIQLFPLDAPTPARQIVLAWRSSSSYGLFYEKIVEFIRPVQKVRKCIPT